MRLINIGAPVDGVQAVWDGDAQHWMMIPAEWQQEMADLLEAWLRNPDYLADPLTKTEVDRAIREYREMNGISAVQADALRAVYREVVRGALAAASRQPAPAPAQAPATPQKPGLFAFTYDDEGAGAAS